MKDTIAVYIENLGFHKVIDGEVNGHKVIIDPKLGYVNR